MINVSTLSGPGLPDDLAAVGVPVHSSDDGPIVACDPGPVEGVTLPTSLDTDWCERQGFMGKVAQVLVLRSLGAVGGSKEPDIVLVGLGPAAALAGDGGLESLRRSAGSFVRAAGKGGSALLVLPAVGGTTVTDAAAAAAEGGSLAAYRYEDFRSAEPTAGLGTLILADGRGGDPGDTEAGAARGARVARSVAMARDLVNEPPSSLTPTRFADVVSDRFAGIPEITVEVWDEGRIAAERLGGVLGVAAGSEQPPRLVRVEYRPAEPFEFEGRVPRLSLVGKGITFDSGGLSLKPAGGMETMKTDMGGAAAVLAAVDAVAALGGRIPITAWAPMTENLPSGTATKPGDVLTARNGKTIEVLNTDAEGRLILADGLSLAVEDGPDAVVDLATLTGAAVVALGKEIACLLGNDEELLHAVRTAGSRAGEPSWPLPLPEDYAAHIESEVADMKNTGRPGQAGTISAALLLQEFVGDVPWAHLDIAGPSRTDDNRWYSTKGGSGFGVRTLVELATSEDFARWLATRPKG
ncbi:MAG: leucyl aminopeptidase [Acidimicrobiales bacterium]